MNDWTGREPRRPEHQGPRVDRLCDEVRWGEGGGRREVQDVEGGGWQGQRTPPLSAT